MPPTRASRTRRVPAEPLPPPAPLLPPPPPPPAPISLPRPEGAWRVLAYIASLGEPIFGLLFAFLYWRTEDVGVRKFARWCLALAVLGWLIQGGTDAVQSGLHRGDWYIQPY